MQKPLCVLIVEDSENDAILLLSELRRGGYDPDYERVDSAEAMKSALKRRTWDIITCDYVMPQFDGLAALRISQEVEPDMPFIIVSGNIGEEIAVAAMKAGANDYIMKSELTRLVAAIERELREADNRRRRRQAEQALMRNEASLAEAQRIAHVGSWDWEIATNIISCSDEFHIFGKHVGNFEAFLDYLLPKDRESFEKAVKEALRANKPYDIEYNIILSNGERRIIHAQGRGILDDTGKPVRMIGTVQDITERKLMEIELQMAEQNIRNSLGSSPLGIRIVTAEGELVYTNQAMLDVYGYSSAEELATTTAQQRHTTESYAEHQARVQLRKQGKPVPSDYEVSIVRKDGQIRHLIASRKAVLWNGEMQFQTIYQDITERKQAEERLEHAAEEWRTTFDSITDSMSIHDKDFKLIRVNQAFANTLKMKPDELIGKTCYQVIHGTTGPVSGCPHKKTLDTKEPATVDFFEPHLGIHLEMATSPIFNDKGEVVASVHVCRDITERKQMEQQLIVNDRLASIGQLASGIAHELNNPLTSIIGFSDLLLAKDFPDEVKEDLKIINREAHRTAEIVKGLLTFARKHRVEKEPVDINGVIGGVLQLRSYEQRVSNIEVNTRFASDLPQVIGNGAQLQQVFINIVVNAEQAMLEANNRGTLTISTERVGDIVRTTLTNDGPEISPENLRQLFTPFFTTKEVGKGTGLGLSICHGIVTAHGGRIHAESESGKGTTFIVELPASK